MLHKVVKDLYGESLETPSSEGKEINGASIYLITDKQIKIVPSIQNDQSVAKPD